MKVLLITNDFPPMVGGEAALYQRVCATIPPDRVLVLAPRVRGDRSFDVRQPYRVLRMRVPTSPHPLARLVQVMGFLVRAIGIVRRERIDAVHIGHLYLGVVGLALETFFQVPYVVYLYGGEMAPYLSSSVVRKVVRMIVRKASTVVVNSHFTRLYYGALGIDNARSELLLMSLETERFRPNLDASGIRAKYGLDGARVILTVGRLVERKGHDMVIRALSRLPPSVGKVRYLIAGAGPAEGRLRALARDLGRSDQVLFIGHSPDEELPYLYAACDVFVMPSRALAQRDGIEGFGIVFLEAAACAKPVIGGRSGGVADAIVDGVTGVLVNPLDADELASVLTRLLLNQDEAARLGMEGRRRVQALESAWAETLTRIWDIGGGGS